MNRLIKQGKNMPFERVDMLIDYKINASIR